MSESLNLTLSSLSLDVDAQSEDWDRSLVIPEPASSSSDIQHSEPLTKTQTPRNSLLFPSEGEDTPRRQSVATGGRYMGPESTGKEKRTLSELLKSHAEKGTNCQFTPEEASRVADVLGQWINASSSPYEGEDDFFTRSQDDSSIRSKRSLQAEGRPRGRSESAHSRPPSSAGLTKA